jgi:hypothetical protein
VSVVLLQEWLGWAVMLPSAALMALGAWLVASEARSQEAGGA